jgi:outer membrane protein
MIYLPPYGSGPELRRNTGGTAEHVSVVGILGFEFAANFRFLISDFLSCFVLCAFFPLCALAATEESAASPPPAPAAPAAEVAAVPPAEPLRIDVQQAVLLALESNRALIVQRMTPEISRTFEDEERAVFDPILSAQGSQRRVRADRLSRAGSGTERSIVDSATGLIAVDKLFPTGTIVGVEAGTNYTDSSLYVNPLTSERLAITVTQALLRGQSVRANLARVHQAGIDTQISEYELRGFTEALVEQVESSFWDYAMAQRQIAIYTDSLRLAEQQMSEAEERIKIGTLAETELAAAQAEVALRRENLITARSTLARERLNLLRLLCPSQAINWDTDILLEYRIELPEAPLDPVEQHVQVALRLRPDLNQARLLIQRDELEVVRTRNGLLPQLDAFITYGKSGYARTFVDAVGDLDGRSYDVEGGLVLALPLGNRAARARHTRAVISKQQSIKALENLVQLAQVDVRSAYVIVTSTREQITATAATRKFQEEKLRVETEKFRVGKSTSLLVAQAQRDLVASQIAEVRAVANHFKALVALFRLEGSLLPRRGLAAPGAEPVVLDERAIDN